MISNIENNSNIKILFITSATHHNNIRNYNHYQRVYFISRAYPTVILGERNANFDISASPNTKIVRGCLPGKFGIILLGLYWLIYGKFRMLLKNEKIILLTEPSILSLLGPLYKILWRCSWAVDVWDIPIRFATATSRFIQWRCRLSRKLLCYAFKMSDLFIMSISPDFEFTYFSVKEHKLLRLRNAIFLDPKRSSHLIHKKRTSREEFSIICMRSLHTKLMGLDILAEGFLKFKDTCPFSRLLIVGSIPNDVEYQISQLRNRHDVEFISFMQHDELLNKMSTCHAFVIPFRNVVDLAQTYPIKVIEAFEMGAPVVASHIAGLMELINDGKTGLLFEDGDSTDLAMKLKLLYDDPNVGYRIAAEAYNDMAQFDCRIKNEIIINRIKILFTDNMPLS
ncbi:MAG: glycosyltransferase family 4 protein [Mobilitalea sp.]